MSELGKFIGKNRVDKDAIKYQFDDAEIIAFLQLAPGTIKVGSGPIRITETTPGTSFIVGHPSLGVFGDSTPQPLLGSNGKTETIIRVANPNDHHRETFRTNDYNDTDNTTANWDTTNFRVTVE